MWTVEGPSRDHNLWVKFAEQVSTLSFPSCSTLNQIEKKQENYNFRLALSLGNISQKRKHKNLEEEFPTRDVGHIHHGNIILESVRAHFKKAVLSARKMYFPNVHLSLTEIWQTGFFSVDFFEVAPRLKLGFFCGWSLSLSDSGAGKFLKPSPWFSGTTCEVSPLTSSFLESTIVFRRKFVVWWERDLGGEIKDIGERLTFSKQGNRVELRSIRLNKAAHSISKTWLRFSPEIFSYKWFDSENCFK